MISFDKKYIFIHQRKCAGMSIFHSAGIDLESEERHLFNDGVLSPEWQTRSKEEKLFFVFICIRNPWDRFVSSCKYLTRYRDLSMTEVLNNMPTEGFDYRHLARPQTDILIDKDGHFIPDCVI